MMSELPKAVWQDRFIQQLNYLGAPDADWEHVDEWAFSMWLVHGQLAPEEVAAAEVERASTSPTTSPVR